MGIIPARGGSKGIPRKNIKKIAGKPLLAYTAKAALGSSYISRVVLSTEDQEIRQVGNELGLEIPFIRPDNLAQDNTPSLPVVQHVLVMLERQENYKPDLIVLLQPTSPLRTSKHIDEALELFINQNADSLVSVTEVPHNMKPYSVMKSKKNGTIVPFLIYEENKNIRQQKPKFFARNGAAIYISTYECIMKNNSLYGSKILPYFMKKEDSFDLDDEIDWKIMESLIKNSS